MTGDSLRHTTAEVGRSEERSRNATAAAGVSEESSGNTTAELELSGERSLQHEESAGHGRPAGRNTTERIRITTESIRNTTATLAVAGEPGFVLQIGFPVGRSVAGVVAMAGVAVRVGSVAWRTRSVVMRNRSVVMWIDSVVLRIRSVVLRPSGQVSPASAVVLRNALAHDGAASPAGAESGGLRAAQARLARAFSLLRWGGIVALPPGAGVRRGRSGVARKRVFVLRERALVRFVLLRPAPPAGLDTSADMLKWNRLFAGDAVAPGSGNRGERKAEELA